MTPEQFDAWFAKTYEGDGAVFRDFLDGFGLAIVPVDPTEGMCEAGDDGHYGMSPRDTWAAMLRASPFAKEEK